MGKVLETIGNSALGGLSSGIGGAVTGLVGGIFGSGKRAQEKQFQKELEKMKYQQQLNQQQAKFNQELALEMWRKTNYGAQIEEMKRNGLNPALIYGQSGQGGTTTGAGQAEGVSMGTSAAVGMGLNAQMQMAQINALNAQAKKSDAEAEKTSGVDTELSKSLTNLNKAGTNLKNAQAEMIPVQIEEINAMRDKLVEETRNISTMADINEETKSLQIERAFYENQKVLFDGIEAMTRGKLNERTLEYVDEQIKYYAFNAYTERMKANAADKAADASGVSAEGSYMSSLAAMQQAETFAKRLAEEIKKWDKSLAQADEKLLQDWIFRSISAATDIGGLLLRLKSMVSGGLKGTATEAAAEAGKGPQSTPTAPQSGGKAVKYDEYRNLVERAKKGDKDAIMQLFP